MFTILEGEIELTFRGEAQRASAGSTVNVPANAPHSFKNKSDHSVRLLCMCTPAGQEEFFMAVGDPVDSRTAPPPKLGPAEQAERIITSKGALRQISNRAAHISALALYQINRLISAHDTGRRLVIWRCPLIGVDWKQWAERPNDAIDPQRTPAPPKYLTRPPLGHLLSVEARPLHCRI